MDGLRFVRYLVAVLSLAGSMSGALADVNITARYLNNKLENTTPLGGHCLLFVCNNGRVSVSLPITYSREVVRYGLVIEERFSLQLPPARTIRLTSDAGDEVELKFRTPNIAIRVRGERLSGTIPPNDGMTGGCIAAQTIPAEGNIYHGLWNVFNPDSPGLCYTNRGAGGSPTTFNLTMDNFSIGYELIVPQPLRARGGTYRGSIDYSVGEQGDFGLGTKVTNLSTSSVRINFELEVVQQLHLEFPANSDRVLLEAEGGWRRWLGGGPAPQRLSREMSFRLSSSGSLGVYMNCEHTLGDACGIRNQRNGHTVPLAVLLTLPPSMQQASGAVQKVPIPVDSAMPLLLESDRPVSNQPARIRFETAPGAVAEMVANPGDTYQGNVTIVFDANL